MAQEQSNTGVHHPPSPFRDGWNSVIPKYYPYPIPTIQKPSKPSSPGLVAIAPDSKQQVVTRSIAPTQPETSTKLKSPKVIIKIPHNPPSNHHHHDDSHPKPPKTKKIFIPKPKKPTARKLIPKSPPQNLNSTAEKSVTSVQPCVDSLVDTNKDPFADWHSPTQEEKQVERKRKEQEINVEAGDEAAQKEGNKRRKMKEEALEELKRALKLDKNLLEIIIRSVFVQIKLTESLKNHHESVAVLNDFKKQYIGFYKQHSIIFEKKLTEAVHKMKFIQFEYDQVSSTIDNDLKSCIEKSVSNYNEIFTAPTINPAGLFNDNWSPKPVTYLDPTMNSNPNPFDTFDHPPPLNQPIKSSLPPDLRQEPIKSSNDDPWGWGNDDENTSVNPNPINPTENKSLECPWGTDEPEETTSTTNPTPALTTANPDESSGWGNSSNKNNNNIGNNGGSGDGDNNWTGKFNNNHHHDSSASWSNPNFGNDSGGWNNQNPTDNKNKFEFRPLDSGWAGRGRGRGGGNVSSEQSGFRGRGRGFGGDRGFRFRGGGDGGGFGGRSRGHRFGNGNGFTRGNLNGCGDGGSNGGWNNSSANGFNSGGAKEFGDTGNSFKSGWGDSKNDSQSGGFGDTGNGFKSGWGDSNNDSPSRGFGDTGNGNKGGWDDLHNSGNDTNIGFGGGSKNSFKNWDEPEDDFQSESNTGGKPGGGGREGAGCKSSGSGELGTLRNSGREGFQSPKVECNRPVVQYDAIATETTNESGATNNNYFANAATSQLKASEDNKTKDTTTNDGNDNSNGWGSPPPKEQVEQSTSSKQFKDLDAGPTLDNLPQELDYSSGILMDKPDKNLNQVKPADEPIQEASKIETDNIQPVQGNEENECPW